MTGNAQVDHRKYFNSFLKMTTTGGGSIEQREVNHAYYKYEDDKYSVSENITIQFENNNAFRIKSAKSNTQVDHFKLTTTGGQFEVVVNLKFSIVQR